MLFHIFPALAACPYLFRPLFCGLCHFSNSRFPKENGVLAWLGTGINDYGNVLDGDTPWRMHIWWIQKWMSALVISMFFFRVDHKRSTWNLQTFFDWKSRNIKPKETKYSNPITSKIGCSPETGNRKWSNWQRQYPTPCGTSLRSFVVHHLSSTALPSCTRPRRNLHLEKWRKVEKKDRNLDMILEYFGCSKNH